MTYFEAMNKCYDEDVKIKRPSWSRGDYIYFLDGLFIYRTMLSMKPEIWDIVMYKVYGYSHKKLNNANVIIPDFFGDDVKSDDWIVAVPGLTL